MANYFRITAYHPEQDLSVTMDSYGLFEKLWHFSADLIQKGFKILEVGNDQKFIEGQIPKTDFEPDKYILRSHQKGKPTNVGCHHEDINYVAIKVGDKVYIPDNTKIL